MYSRNEASTKYFFASFRDNLKKVPLVYTVCSYSFAKIDIHQRKFPSHRASIGSFQMFQTNVVMHFVCRKHFEIFILSFDEVHLYPCLYEAMSSRVVQLDQQKDYLLYWMLKLGRRFDCCVRVFEFL